MVGACFQSGFALVAFVSIFMPQMVTPIRGFWLIDKTCGASIGSMGVARKRLFVPLRSRFGIGSGQGRYHFWLVTGGGVVRRLTPGYSLAPLRGRPVCRFAGGISSTRSEERFGI
jgi:hypothetical protein